MAIARGPRARNRYSLIIGIRGVARPATRVSKLRPPPPHPLSESARKAEARDRADRSAAHARALGPN